MGIKQDISLFAGSAFYHKARADSFTLRQGLVLQISHISPATALATDFEIHDSPLIFGFMLAGSNHCHYKRGTLSEMRQHHTSGSNSITYLPDTSGSMDCEGGMYRLSIITAQDFLAPYLDEEKIKMPRQLHKAFSGDVAAFQWIGKCRSEKMQLVSDIFTSAYSGVLRNLHLEIRALELIEMQLAEYLYADEALGRPPALKTSDVWRIKEARELLVQDMENPPSIAQLANMTGLSEKKLKVGFKIVFGLPIFEYFRNYRLEIARELLAARSMNVTEVGMYIGYQNLSHFSREFFKRYGVNPKKFQDNGRWHKE